MKNIDLQSLTDGEVMELFDNVRMEYQKRLDFIQTMNSMPGVAEAYMASIGKAMGEEFIVPTGYKDAYPLGWIVKYEGKEWCSLVESARDLPGATKEWIENVNNG